MRADDEYSGKRRHCARPFLFGPTQANAFGHTLHNIQGKDVPGILPLYAEQKKTRDVRRIKAANVDLAASMDGTVFCYVHDYRE